MEEDEIWDQENGKISKLISKDMDMVAKLLFARSLSLVDSRVLLDMTWVFRCDFKNQHLRRTLPSMLGFDNLLSLSLSHFFRLIVLYIFTSNENSARQKTKWEFQSRSNFT